MKNIVWLTEWLPTPLEPYAGDGIERRAKAASLYNNLVLIYIKKKPGLRKGTTERQERVYNQHCRAVICFYPAASKQGGLLDILLSNYYFIKLHLRELRVARKALGSIAGIQVNVSMKNGIIALFYKCLTGIQYIVVEGWSFFLPEAEHSFKKKNWLFRFLNRKVFSNARLLVTVSEHLGKMINKHIINVPFVSIPSVVDTSIFFLATRPVQQSVFVFIHVSSLDHPKNFEQILEAVKMVVAMGYQMELHTHGPDRKKIKQLSADLGLEHIVSYKSEMEQPLLAAEMRQAHALILYSRYETFGNVIIEANACGLPVIVSNYPTFREIITEGLNGITAEGNNPGALSKKMMYMIDNYSLFDASVIAAGAADTYNFNRIGKKFDDLYKKFF